MASTIDNVREFLAAQPLLEPGEPLVAAAKGMPLGGVKAWSKRTGAAWAGGAVGALVMSHQSGGDGDSLEAALKAGAYLAVTDRRVVLLQQGGMRGKPVAAVATIDRARITAVEEGTTRVSLVKMVTLTIRCDDETEIAFEFPKPETNDARSVLAALGAA